MAIVRSFQFCFVATLFISLAARADTFTGQPIVATFSDPVLQGITRELSGSGPNKFSGQLFDRCLFHQQLPLCSSACFVAVGRKRDGSS
jgi:hypothetical protein